MAAAAPAEAAPLRIMVFGDSIGAGYGLEAGQSFPQRLAANLKTDGHDVAMIDKSVSGDTSAGGLARIDDALRQKPDIVLVELGANDALRGINPSYTYRNLDAIVARFAAAHIKVMILGMRGLANWGRDYQNQFDAIYPKLAAAHHVSLYPFLLDGVALDPKLNQPDLLHPNAAGAALIARRLTHPVEELIAQP